MADPYALLAANDQRYTAGFESINRNAIAKFNAEAEAAKFGFQAHMQVAQLEEQRLQGIADRDNATRRLNIEEKRMNQSMALAKVAGARQLAEADREFNYRIAGEARQNLDSQLDALGTEESQWQAASLSGDPLAGEKIKEIQAKKQELRSQMGDVYNRLKTEMDSGNTMNMGKAIRDLDALLEGREPDPVEPPDDMLSSVGQDFTENPEDLPLPDENYSGVLPPHPGRGPNTLTGSAPVSTEPVANSMITSATRQNTEVARNFFPAALNEATRKAVGHFKNWLGGAAPDTKNEPAKVATAIGNVLVKDPSTTPDGGVVELDSKQASHFKGLIRTDYATVPENLRPSLLQGKRRAYSSLLQAGDPEIKAQYEVLHRLGTSPDVTDTQADAQLQDAVKEGMIDDHTRRSWLLQKQGNIAAKGKTADPMADPMKQVASSLELLAKAQELEKTGSAESKQNPIVLGDEFKNILIEGARSTLAHFQLDQGAKALMARIDYAKHNGGSADMINALETELSEKSFAKGRLYADERLPQLNSQLRSKGVLGEGESAIALAKQGQATFIKVLSDRMRATGMTEADAKASANVLYTQYSTAAPYIGGETDPTTGAVLPAPKPIQLQVGPSSAAANTVVDNTFTGIVKEVFSDITQGSEQDPLKMNEIAVNALKNINVSPEKYRARLAGVVDAAAKYGSKNTVMSNINGWAQKWTPAQTGSGTDGTGSGPIATVWAGVRKISEEIADERTEEVFSKGAPNQAEIDSLRNDIKVHGVYGTFDLTNRTDFHQALKKVTAIKLGRDITSTK